MPNYVVQFVFPCDQQSDKMHEAGWLQVDEKQEGYKNKDEALPCRQKHQAVSLGIHE